jgi:hypothetical protein
MGDAAATGAARETLNQLTSAIDGHLGSGLLGLYLFGSLAGGGFYAGKSDLDVMAVVTAGIEEGQQLEELRALHEAFVAERPAWVERIEVVYADRDVLRTLTDRPRGRSPTPRNLPAEGSSGTVYPRTQRGVHSSCLDRRRRRRWRAKPIRNGLFRGSG